LARIANRTPGHATAMFPPASQHPEPVAEVLLVNMGDLGLTRQSWPTGRRESNGFPAPAQSLFCSPLAHRAVADPSFA